MARNGSGTYSLLVNSWNPAVATTSATTADWQALINDLATAMTQSVSADGQTVLTGDLNFNSLYRPKNVIAATASGHPITYGQGSWSLAAGTFTGTLTATSVTFSGSLSVGTTSQFTGAANFSGATTFDATSTIVISSTASGTEGGEFRLLKPPSGSTLSDNITVDISTNSFRIFENTSPQRGISINLTNMGAGVGTALGVIRGYLSGCTLSTAGASTTMTIAAGTACDSTNVAMMEVSTISKTTSAWAVGNAQGGLDTGAIANSTWYHFYAIRRPDTATVDVTFSTNATTPTLPANYTQYRRIGSGLTNGSGQWVAFTQDGDLFQLSVPVLETTSATPGTSAVTQTLANVPTGVNVRAIFNASVAQTQLVYFSDLATTDAAPSGTVAPLSALGMVGSGSNFPVTQQTVRTNTSAQIRYRSSVNGQVFIATIGWFDTRGK